MKPWAHERTTSEFQYVMEGIAVFLEQLENVGATVAQIERFKENFTGKNRRFDALEAAFFAHYNWRTKRIYDDNPELRKQKHVFVDFDPSGERREVERDNQFIDDGNLKSQAAEIQKQIEKAIATSDASFFRDFAFFLEKPLRKYSRLKVWLVGINFIQTGYLKSETSTDWYSPRVETIHKPGEQTQLLTGEHLALLYQAEMGDEMELSQIYRACRELGIKTKHPKKSPRRKK